MEVDNLFRFEELYRQAFEIKAEYERADVFSKASLYLDYENRLNECANVYYKSFDDIGLYETFLKREINSFIDKDYKFYLEYFTEDFIENVYIKSERLPFYKILITEYGVKEDLTELLLSVADIFISYNWYYSYHLVDIFNQFDNPKALPFMVKVIEDINNDEDKYEGDLFMNTIAFCVDKLSKTNSFYHRLEQVLETTVNDDVKRNLSYYLNQVNS